MKKLILPIIIFLYCEACISNDANKATEKVMEALLEVEEIKKVTNRTEKIIEKILPVEKEMVSTIGTAAITLVNKKINTNDINNLDMSLFGGKARADIEYDFKTKKSNTFIQLNWSW